MAKRLQNNPRVESVHSHRVLISKMVYSPLGGVLDGELIQIKSNEKAASEFAMNAFPGVFH